MRGELLYQILDFVEDRSVDTTTFLLAFLRAGYGSTLAQREREYRSFEPYRQKIILTREKKRNLQKYLSKLKADGLLREGTSTKLTLSVRGKKRLRSMKRRQVLEEKNYRMTKGSKVVIISYDLPTPFNYERDILRRLLRLLGFRMIHKSVWVGKVKVPHQFLLALNELKILKFVEILEVTKNGSLSAII